MKVRSQHSFKFLAIVTLLALIAGVLPTFTAQAAWPVWPPAPPKSHVLSAEMTVLPNGNIVVADPSHNNDSTKDVGAVYLYDGDTFELISVLTGSTVLDQISSGGITVLNNSSFVVLSPLWNNGAAEDAGAITWCSGTKGCAGPISPENSLTGSASKDQVGFGAAELPSGDYLALSPYWDNGKMVDAGAATWCDGTKGCTGAVQTADSLHGASAYDLIGYAYLQSGVIVLPSGDYLVISPFWDNGKSLNAGAITRCSGKPGCTGPVTSENSLVGNSHFDHIGYAYWGISVTVLPNGSYVVQSPVWDNGMTTDAGALTWCNGKTGCTGIVSPDNSLTGSSIEDHVGNRIEILPNSSYLALTPEWDHDKLMNAGALTWCSGTEACTGKVSTTNSLVGSAREDKVGSRVMSLSNGNYLAVSPEWDNGAMPDSGAVTWCSGAKGCTGPISSENSLVGGAHRDFIGSSRIPRAGGIALLQNSNYVVISPDWDLGQVTDVGAVTWCSGTTGCTGLVSTENSLTGSSTGDRAGLGGVNVLPNNNFVALSPSWDNRYVIDAGAVTWCSGTTGCTGSISMDNSLTGSTIDDRVGYHGMTILPNSSYVVPSPFWDNGNAENAGAITWCEEAMGCTGAVSPANSLTGSSDEDRVGAKGITILPNGSYVATSPNWDNGNATDAGAVTWCSGKANCSGMISSENSLVGDSIDDLVGKEIRILPNSNYLVISPYWNDLAAINAGAVTWCSAASGCQGIVSPENSLVGISLENYVGEAGVEVLPNSSYVVLSPRWGKDVDTNAGAVTWCSGTNGCPGVISSDNSLVGSSKDDGVGMDMVILPDGNYLVFNPYWDRGSATDAGAITWCSLSEGCAGTISAENSLVGSSDHNYVGTDHNKSSLAIYPDSTYAILSPFWDNGEIPDVGAVTWCNQAGGCRGAVTADNSLIGRSVGDQVGSQLTVLPNGSSVIISPFWDNRQVPDAGAVTWCDQKGCQGIVSAENSLVGNTTLDRIGNRLTILSNNNFIVLSLGWDNGEQSDAGAITFCSGATACLGSITPKNSFIGGR